MDSLRSTSPEYLILALSALAEKVPVRFRFAGLQLIYGGTSSYTPKVAVPPISFIDIVEIPTVS